MIVPSKFLKSEKWCSLSSSARSTFLCLAIYADDDGTNCFPSINTIAENMRMNRHTVIDSISELEEKAIVSKDNKPGKKANYTLNVSTEPVLKEAPVLKTDITGAQVGTAPVLRQAPDQTITNTLPDQLDVFDSQKKVPEKRELTKGSIRTFPENSPECQLAITLRDEITLNGSSMKEPDLNKWADIFDKMHRIDKKDYDWLLQIIGQVFKDDFWKGVIRSPEKLRTQINSGKLDRLIKNIKKWDSDEMVIKSCNEEVTV
jgi:hypothetical protein